jgi:hypothetical protein
MRVPMPSTSWDRPWMPRYRRDFGAGSRRSGRAADGGAHLGNSAPSACPSADQGLWHPAGNPAGIAPRDSCGRICILRAAANRGAAMGSARRWHAASRRLWSFGASSQRVSSTPGAVRTSALVLRFGGIERDQPGIALVLQRVIRNRVQAPAVLAGQTYPQSTSWGCPCNSSPRAGLQVRLPIAQGARSELSLLRPHIAGSAGWRPRA